MWNGLARIVGGKRELDAASVSCACGKDIYRQEINCFSMTASDKKSPYIPTVVTLVAGICWALLMIYYVLFWGQRFDWLQNIGVVFLSLVVMGCVVGLMWVQWVFKR